MGSQRRRERARTSGGGSSSRRRCPTSSPTASASPQIEAARRDGGRARPAPARSPPRRVPDPAGPGRAATADHRARGVGRDAVLAASRRDRGRPGRRQRDQADPARQRRRRRAARRLGGVEDGRAPLVADDVRELARLRNAAAQRGRLPGLVRALRRHLGDGRGEADRDARRGRPRDRGAVRALEGRARRERSRPASAARSTSCAPWHYADPFFQEVPAEGGVDLDPLLGGARPRRARRGGRSTGSGSRRAAVLDAQRPLPARGQVPARVLHRHRPGRATFACSRTSSPASTGWTRCCTSSATRRSTRASIRALPWLLRDCHLVVTEGIAILMGRLAGDAEWLERVLGVDPDEVAGDRRGPPGRSRRRAARLHPLGARDDELRALRSTPIPESDLDARWWELVERYQLVTPPAGRASPDWAAKIHVACAPGLLPHVPLRADRRLAARRDAASASAAGSSAAPTAGRPARRAGLRPGAVGALGPADRAGDRRAADGGALRARHHASERLALPRPRR